MPNTHCLPTGSLQTSEIAVCNISDGTVSPFIPTGGVGSGNIRGIVVFFNGFDIGFNTGQGIPPILFGDSGTAAFFSYLSSWKNLMVNDGWLVLMVPSNEWSANGYGSTAVYNAANADAGHGSNYLAGLAHLWDHIVNYCNRKYPGMPLVPFGFSWGGYEAIQIASTRSSTLLAAAAHCPATWLRNANAAFTGPSNFGQINTSGLDVQSNALASVTIPMAVGYGTSDEAIGHGGTSTIGTFSTTAAASVTTLPLVSAAEYNSSVAITVPTTGGLGYATYTIGSISSNNLNGLTLVSGSGNVVSGSTVTQSTTVATLAAAPANVIGNVTSDYHEFSPADAGQALTSTSSPTALSSMGTLTVANTGYMTGSSGLMSIYASDNLWHTVTFSGSTGTTFTGCTYSGTQSATVVNGSPICLSGDGVTNPFSYPYWFSTVVDPLAPRMY